MTGPTDTSDAVAQAERELLRHEVATVAYRTAKAVRDAPESFGAFEPGEGARTPVQLVSHIGDLMDWALSMARGKQVWNVASPQTWPQELERCFDSIAQVDAYLAGDQPLGAPVRTFLQGPMADALTHVGQLITLRRLAGHRIRSENYARAAIAAGRVGRDQTPAGREFD
jgi:hypothetical protein